MLIDVLIAVEDPGAANFIVELPHQLAKNNISFVIISFGCATKFLIQRNIKNKAFSELGSIENLLNLYQFKILLAGTSQNKDSIILKLIDKCKSISIPTIGLVDMAVDADMRFLGKTNNPLFYKPDELIVPDKFTFEEFVKLGFEPNRIYITSHPSLQRIRNISMKMNEKSVVTLREKLYNFNPSPRPIWIFVAEHQLGDPRNLRSPEYTLFGRGDSILRTQIVLEEVLDIAKEFLPKPFIVLRLHPKNNLEEFSNNLNEVDFISNGDDPLPYIFSSDLVLGLSSILIMEAAYAAKPTLSIVPRLEECNWCPSVLHNLTPCITTRSMLLEAIKNINQMNYSFPIIKEQDSILNILKTKFL